MTLSEAESAAACESSRTSVVQVLTGIGRTPLAALCGRTHLKLTPFVHGTPPEAQAVRYRVEPPPNGGFKVTLLIHIICQLKTRTAIP